MPYPEWFFYPDRDRPPEWVDSFLSVVTEAQTAVDSLAVDGLNSDRVLEHLRPGLEGLGFEVERGKKASEKVRRPVLFGEQGTERVAYEVDAFHDEFEIVVEVEAGRGALGNAVYRDLIRASLIVDAQYLTLDQANPQDDRITHSAATPLAMWPPVSGNSAGHASAEFPGLAGPNLLEPMRRRRGR